MKYNYTLYTYDFLGPYKNNLKVHNYLQEWSVLLHKISRFILQLYVCELRATTQTLNFGVTYRFIEPNLTTHSNAVTRLLYIFIDNSVGN